MQPYLLLQLYMRSLPRNIRCSLHAVLQPHHAFSVAYIAPTAHLCTCLPTPCIYIYMQFDYVPIAQCLTALSAANLQHILLPRPRPSAPSTPQRSPRRRLHILVAGLRNSRRILPSTSTVTAPPATYLGCRTAESTALSAATLLSLLAIFVQPLLTQLPIRPADPVVSPGPQRLFFTPRPCSAPSFAALSAASFRPQRRHFILYVLATAAALSAVPSCDYLQFRTCTRRPPYTK